MKHLTELNLNVFWLSYVILSIFFINLQLNCTHNEVVSLSRLKTNLRTKQTDLRTSTTKQLSPILKQIFIYMRRRNSMSISRR